MGQRESFEILAALGKRRGFQWGIYYRDGAKFRRFREDLSDGSRNVLIDEIATESKKFKVGWSAFDFKQGRQQIGSDLEAKLLPLYTMRDDELQKGSARLRMTARTLHIYGHVLASDARSLHFGEIHINLIILRAEREVGP